MEERDNTVVVGIGSSAGGLEALQIMLSNLPDIENCSYVIAQHLSPTHKSMMVELLSRTTNIPVIEVKNGMRIKSKTIYMTPENTDIYVKGNKLYLKTLEQSFSPKPSVNYFFSSLAQSYGDKAIGIILSGTGSDGAYGIRAVKAGGGITIAQAPSTAKYDGMPLSAINTGKVDIVVPIDTLGQEIKNIVMSLENRKSLSIDEKALQQIYRLLFNDYGVDFSLYKKNTITRRIERRLAALKIKSLHAYLEILQKTPQEIEILYHDILIGVTDFFRDPEAFEKVREQILGLVFKKEQGEEIRFWSIGCSTGEEAYSLAIILSEILQEKISKFKIKIFATDIDSEALKIARTGIYAETALTGVAPNIIKKYFTIQKNHYEIKKSIRELVIFSKHNVISDSPFLRLDLVSCRNMLIYFSNTLQDKFFPIVHYALNDNGVLFLGKSESVGAHIDLFSTIDKTAKIFKAQFTGVKEPPKLYNYSMAQMKNDFADVKKPRHRNEEDYIEDLISQGVQDVLLKNCVVINSSNDIVYIKGDLPYLKPREGKVSNNIFRQINDDISLDLRTALNKVAKEKKLQMTPFRSITIFEDIIRYLRVIVTPVEDEKSDDWLYVLFFQLEEAQNIKGHIVTSGDEAHIVEKLTLELNATKSHLQNVIEELETSYEEMQSLNEELQSSNEELQSSNEELETTNEELQSTNEELQTAYSELRVLYEDKEKRALQLESLTEKLSAKTEEYRKQKELTEGILDTAPIAITMADKNGQIIYANNYAQNLFELPLDDLLNRRFDSKEWNFTTFNGEEINPDDLPFSIIKRTYKPVHRIEHTVLHGFNKLYLSVSGSPQFDFEGKFQGAVFCIENLTEAYNSKVLSNNILDTGIYSNEHNFSFLELSLLDLSFEVKNVLSKLSLELATMSENDELVESANKKITNVAEILDEKIDYYTNKINYKRESVVSCIQKFMKIFELILTNNSFEYEMKLDESLEKIIEIKSLQNMLYTFLNSIIEVANEKHAKAPKLEIVNSFERQKYTILLQTNIQVTKTDLEALHEKLQSLLKLSIFKVEMNPKKSLVISFEA